MPTPPFPAVFNPAGVSLMRPPLQAKTIKYSSTGGRTAKNPDPEGSAGKLLVDLDQDIAYFDRHDEQSFLGESG